MKLDRDTTHQQEKKWYSFWEKEGLFSADSESLKPSYSLLMPPPNLTGELHLGHALQHAILDALARFKRMQGYNVLLLPGVDHAGIQFEGTFNKRLAKENLSKQKLGREEWMKRAWEFRDEVYKSFHTTWTIMGISADWKREVFTLDKKMSQAVFTEFSTFWKDDLLYKDAYIVQWCPKCGTAIEDVEMEYEEKKEKLFYIKYPIAEKEGKTITIATGRPETIFADTAIVVYPGHPTYKDFIGLHAINPLTKTHIPILADSRVEKEFGTGALKITPGHDPVDYAIGKDHGTPILHVINKLGRLDENAVIQTPNGPETLENSSLEDGRNRVVAYLGQTGALEKVEDYTHSVPVCERCKTVVQPLISEEWFVKMRPLADNAVKTIKEDKIAFLPTHYDDILTTWLTNIHDWCISRSLWWGHRIPVWYCQKCNKGQKVDGSHGMAISQEMPTDVCSHCGANDWIQDEKIFDTWFSSGLWPLATLGWPEKTNDLKKFFPWDFEISAPEIKYLWIARMIMLSLYLKKSIPFKTMFFHGMLRDTLGRKFSKSLGNGIDPKEFIEQWGTDNTRMVLYSYSAAGRDSKVSRQILDQRAKNYRNFSTKLTNIARFILELAPEDAALTPSSPLHPDDQWIMDELDKTIIEVTKQLDSCNLHLAIESLYEFSWHTFADVYIEKVKSRRNEAQPILEKVYLTIITLLHPFMPFLTESLYEEFYTIAKSIELPKKEKSIMLTSWPKNEIKNQK